MKITDKLLSIARWFAKKFLEINNFDYELSKLSMINDSAKVTIRREDAELEEVLVPCWKCDLAKDDLEFIREYPNHVDGYLEEHYSNGESPIDYCDVAHEFVDNDFGYFFHEEISEEETYFELFIDSAYKYFDMIGFPCDEDGQIIIQSEDIPNAIRNINFILNSDEIIESHTEEESRFDDTEKYFEKNENNIYEIIVDGSVYYSPEITKEDIESDLCEIREVLFFAKLKNSNVIVS